ERDTTPPLADHDLDRLLIQVVALAELLHYSARPTGFGLLLQIHQFAVEYGRVDLELADDADDLLIAGISSLCPHDGARVGLQKEHVSLAEQLLSANLIEHNTAVGAIGHLEANPGGEVRLDEPRDDINRRTLRRQDQVDARSPRLLGQPDD